MKIADLESRVMKEAVFELSPVVCLLSNFQVDDRLSAKISLSPALSGHLDKVA